jgi:hypothetical protein
MQEIALRAVGTSSKRQLAQLIERGEYVVDTRAVAEAMLQRLERVGSPVLVAAQPVDRPPVRAEQDETVSRDNLA